MATGCGVLATAVLTSVTAAAPSVVDDSAPQGTGVAAIDDPRDSIEELRNVLRVGKRDLADLKTLASKLGAAMDRIHGDDAHELSEQRRKVLDDVSTLQETLPRIQARARALSSEANLAERVYRETFPDDQFSSEEGGE